VQRNGMMSPVFIELYMEWQTFENTWLAEALFEVWVRAISVG
jgi:hypothetical protein